MKIYLDTSALVKLVVQERESAALNGYLTEAANDTVFSAALARTELLRAASPHGQTAIQQARALLETIDTIALTHALLDAAGTLGPPQLRSLDAIHLAAAQRAGEDLRAILTYDRRMAAAASAIGLPVQAPQ